MTNTILCTLLGSLVFIIIAAPRIRARNASWLTQEQRISVYEHQIVWDTDDMSSTFQWSAISQLEMYAREIFITLVTGTRLGIPRRACTEQNMQQLADLFTTRGKTVVRDK